MTDLKTLIRLLKQQSKDAFDELYSQYSTRFYWYARRRGLSHEDAEDVTHETFFRIVQNVHSMDEKRNIQAFIWRICHNVTVDKLHDKWSEVAATAPLPETGDEEVLAGGLTPEEELALREEQHRIAAFERAINRCATTTLDTLSPGDRDEIDIGPRRNNGERGPVRRAWKDAMGRWVAAFLTCLETTRLA